MGCKICHFEIPVDNVEKAKTFYEKLFGWKIERMPMGDEKEYFSPSGLAILDNQGNQYESEYGGNLDRFSEIYPNVKKSGYLIFKKIPATSQSIKLIFELGHDESYDPYTFEYNIQLAK